MSKQHLEIGNAEWIVLGAVMGFVRTQLHLRTGEFDDLHFVAASMTTECSKIALSQYERRVFKKRVVDGRIVSVKCVVLHSPYSEYHRVKGSIAIIPQPQGGWYIADHPHQLSMERRISEKS